MINTLMDVFTYLGVAVVGLFVWAAFSPFETMGWWAGWFGDKIYTDKIPSDGLLRMVRPNAHCYIVFLSGVGRVSSKTVSFREQDFLQRLAHALPNAVIIDDVFPYSVNNLALTGQPYFARFWRWAFARKRNGSRIAGNFINLRNIFQILASADKRYGPMFNQATAEILTHGLLRYDYDPQGDVPVYVIGYSGSGQMAVGAARYMKEWIQAPLYVISIGGVFKSDPGLDAMDHLYHLYGAKDRVHKFSLADLGRWPIYRSSIWNRVRREGKVTEINVGPMGHSGRGAYLDAKTALADGTLFVDKTVAVIKEIVAPHTVVDKTASQAPTPS